MSGFHSHVFFPIDLRAHTFLEKLCVLCVIIVLCIPTYFRKSCSLLSYSTLNLSFLSYLSSLPNLLPTRNVNHNMAFLETNIVANSSLYPTCLMYSGCLTRMLNCFLSRHWSLLLKGESWFFRRNGHSLCM